MAEADARPSRAARTLVRLRVPIVLAWVVAAAASAQFLPDLADADTASLSGLVASGSQAVASEQRSLELFRIPILSRAAVVQRDEDGLTAAEQTRVFDRALDINERRDPLFRTIVFALPITNTGALFPGSRERGTTAITYLYFRPDASLNARDSLARTYAQRIAEDGDPVTGVAGAVPARREQWRAIEGALPRVEAATVLLITLLLAAAFRSIGPPLVVLAAAGLAYLVAAHVLAGVGRLLEVPVPREIQPVMVVLLLGVVTDYAVFFVSTFRRRVSEGADPLTAAAVSIDRNTRLVGTAGLIVALGTGALVVGRLEFFRALGPGSALTVVVALAVSLTFVPALLAVLGRVALWPRGLVDPPAAATATPRLLGLPLRSRPVAALAAAGTAVVLGAGAVAAFDLRLGFTLVRGLDDSTDVKRATVAAADGFSEGILSPTLLLVEGEGLDERRLDLARLQRLVAGEAGVAGVVGPANVPRGVELDVFVTPDGRAARFVVVLESDPLSAQAISELRHLRQVLPQLLERADLSGLATHFAGDTALAGATVDQIVDDSGRIAVAALLVNLVLLALFLRSVVAPLYLLASNALALGAALGLLVLVFQQALGYGDVTYYVPFAAAVLLLSLGSDYNVFIVGRIWDAARTRDVSSAVALAIEREAVIIRIAAFALAGSFAMLALVPLAAFREFAFLMFVGVLADAFVVRSILVPALVVVVGRKSWWPSPVPPEVHTER